MHVRKEKPENHKLTSNVTKHTSKQYQTEPKLNWSLSAKMKTKNTQTKEGRMKCKKPRKEAKASTCTTCKIKHVQMPQSAKLNTCKHQKSEKLRAKRPKKHQ